MESIKLHHTMWYSLKYR